MSGLDWHVPDDELDDLRRRVRATRWPAPWPTPAWEAGTDQSELRRLNGYWADGYDWRAQENEINALPHHRVDINGVTTHFSAVQGRTRRRRADRAHQRLAEHLLRTGRARAAAVGPVGARPARGRVLHGRRQHSTRPLTLAYALTDSPVGLLGWIIEKYRAWSDNTGGLRDCFTDDFLLTQASLYWFTNTIGTSLRPYYEYGRGVSRGLSWVPAPTAVALFPADLARPPRSWAERTHNVVRFTEMPRGGHFAPVEVPDLLARDVLEFAAQVQRDT